MQCEEFELRWQDLLDERRAPEEDASLRAHAESCVACRRLWNGHEVLLTGLDVFERPELPANFAASVVAKFRSGASPVESHEPVLAERANPAAETNGFQQVGWRLAIAVLAVAIVVGVYLSSNQNAPPLPGPQAHPAAPQAPMIAEVPQPVSPQPTPVQPPKPMIPAPSESLAMSMPGETLQLEGLLETVRSQLPPEAGQQSSEYAAEVVDRFRPVASPVTSLFNVLLRTIPSGKDGPRKPQAAMPYGLDAELA